VHATKIAPVGFLGNFGRALGEGVRNFREELTDAPDGKGAEPSPPKPRESVPSQLGAAVRKGRESLGLEQLQSEVQSLRSELGDLKESVGRERDGLRDSLKGQPVAPEAPGTTAETPADHVSTTGE
jgi:Sec-independent protein translocase protein TatA